MPWLWNYPRGQTHCPLATPVGLKDQRGQRIWGHKETPVTGKGVWGRTDACICVWLSPSAVHPKLLQHCLLISLTPIQNKKFKKREIPFMPNSRMQFFSCFFFFFFFLIFWPHLAACGILVPQPGMELLTSTLAVQSLSHWRAREVLKMVVLILFCFVGHVMWHVGSSPTRDWTHVPYIGSTESTTGPQRKFKNGNSAVFNEWITEGSEMCDFPGGSVGKESAYNAGDPGLIPGMGRSPGVGNGNPLPYPCLGNPTDREAWWVTIHGVAKSWPWLSMHAHTHNSIASKQFNLKMGRRSR